MNAEIYLIESHPIREEIILTGGFEGTLLLWDIKEGILLNMFQEIAIPIHNPQLENPVVDARFAPDGLSFVVTTFYGSFSVFGYGSKSIYNYAYYDQVYA